MPAGSIRVTLAEPACSHNRLVGGIPCAFGANCVYPALRLTETAPILACYQDRQQTLAGEMPAKVSRSGAKLPMGRDWVARVAG